MMPPVDITSIPTTSGKVKQTDISSIISPLVRAVKENIVQGFDKLKFDLIKSGFVLDGNKCHPIVFVT